MTLFLLDSHFTPASSSLCLSSCLPLFLSLSYSLYNSLSFSLILRLFASPSLPPSLHPSLSLSFPIRCSSFTLFHFETLLLQQPSTSIAQSVATSSPSEWKMSQPLTNPVAPAPKVLEGSPAKLPPIRFESVYAFLNRFMIDGRDMKHHKFFC